MDAKDLRTESALSERSNDSSKYSQSGGIPLHCDRNKSYQDIGSSSLAKVDVQGARPCAVIGPDRVVPPPATSDAYLKKGQAEPWPCMDNAYHTQQPPEYPHKLANFQNPSRNISPRQTFQENMQRIMVPPSYNSVKISDATNYVQMTDRSNGLPKNIKINVPPEAKFCDVPYTVYPTSNEQKNVRNSDMCIPSVNPTLTRTAPHGWPPGSVNIRPTRPYGAPELYQYQEYPSCAGPRPVVPRPNRTVPEESGYVYADPFYHQEGNIRFKPYPTVKDRYPQQRYDYIGNYANSFHTTPAFPSHKYDLSKTVPPHPYPPYPPIKYLDRVPDPVMEGYQRNQQGSYNLPYRNQIIHPNYGPVLGNSPQNKIHSYPPEGHNKPAGPHKLPFDNSKAYIDYDNGRSKMYPQSESYLVNEMGRMHPMKSQVIMPNYPTINMHNIPPNPYYKKDNQQMKNYEYIQTHFRSMDPNINIHNPMVRHPSVFSPNTSAISPTDSSASNDTSQTLGTSQEDCGYVSQSSTASVRSMDSAINRIQSDYLRKYYDGRFGPIIRSAPIMSRSDLSSNNSKEKKNIDVRQFLQMWNEGEEETEENSSKEIIIQAGPKSDNNFGKPHEIIGQPNQEQLYVLGLVNVPSEELGKYEHIQKVSKLPENIKGYNHIELLNQFEEAIEFSNMSNYKTSTPKNFQVPSKAVSTKQTTAVMQPRPLSPLDVEAKISQSVIHKEVGCNFEIRPCSPKMMNVDVATPVQNILAERAIEKVTNPVMLKSPRMNVMDENIDCNIMKRKDHRININNETVRIPSCKMVNTQFSNNNGIDSIKNSYSLQDLESNSGLCLASLPRLDNDIELNFPEVNQQFINANKGDPSVSNPLRDLPNLELLDHSDGQTKDKCLDINSINHVTDVIKDSDKEFSKLSKYRKTKPLETKENQKHLVINAARTDSVIIKNPENAKNYEERAIFSPNCHNKQSSDTQEIPIYLTSQGSIIESPENIPSSIESPDKNVERETPIENAIDFSLTKSSTNDIVESMGLKTDRETETITHTNNKTNHSILDDHLLKLPTFSNCDPQQTFISHDKLNDNTMTIENNELVLIPNDKNNKANANLTENLQLREILLNNECLSPMSVRESSNDSGCLLPALSTNINAASTTPSVPVEFEASTTELLQNDSNSSLMDINKDFINNEVNKSIKEKSLEDFNNVTRVKQTNFLDDTVSRHANVEDCGFEVAPTRNQIQAELKSEIPKDSFSEIRNPLEVEDANNVNSTDFDLINKNKVQSETEITDSIISIPSPIDVLPNTRDDNRIEISKNDYELNLPSPIHNSPCCATPEVTEQEEVSHKIPSPYCPKDNPSENAQQQISSDFELASSNKSVTQNLNDNKLTEQDKSTQEESYIDSNSINKVETQSPNNYQSDITEPKSSLNVYTPSNNATKENLNVNASENTQPKIDCNIRISENLNSYTPETSQHDIEYDTGVSDNINEQTSENSIKKNDCKTEVSDYLNNNTLETSQLDIDFNTGVTGNIKHMAETSQPNLDCDTGVLDKLNDYTVENLKENCLKSEESDKPNQGISKSLLQENEDSNIGVSDLVNKHTSETSQQDIVFDTGVLNNLNEYTAGKSLENCLKNDETYKQNEYISEPLQQENEDSNIEVSNNVVKTEPTKNIINDNMTAESSSSEEKQCEYSLHYNAEEKIHQTMELSSELDKCTNQGTKYLWYGSKAMYSPWIQNLIIFNEGYVHNNNINLNEEMDTFIKHRASKKIELQIMETPLVVDSYEISDESRCVIPAVLKETKTVIRVCEIDINGPFNENCETMKDDEEFISNKILQTDKVCENDDIDPTLDEVYKVTDIESNIYTDESKLATTNEMENNLEKVVLSNPGDAGNFCLSPEMQEQWEEQPNCDDISTNVDGRSSDDKISRQWNKESNCIDDIPNLWDKQFINQGDPDHWDREFICNAEINDPWDKYAHDATEQWDKASNCTNDNEVEKKFEQADDLTSNSNEITQKCNRQSDCREQVPTEFDQQQNFNELLHEQSDELPNCKDVEADLNNVKKNSTKVQIIEHNILNKKRRMLKRSLSDSALNTYNDNNSHEEDEENIHLVWPSKRRKNNTHNNLLAQDLCNIIQNNRRNSISAVYNEDNVSFCILIDNGCIIAEENDEQEKMCYTELTEECLAEIQNNCLKEEENIEDVTSETKVMTIPQLENENKYSNSFVMQCEDEKLEETWVEDVACVETVISDDVAEDIEISGRSSPNDDTLSDNDESGVFSSSEHTDKVKYIYGEKMCNDDAQFVETLYNTPQMNVNKTLFQRESKRSSEYYDSISLEKILSESNDQELSPYGAEYTEPVFSPVNIDIEEIENQQSMSISPLQSKVNPLNVVVDTGINKIEHENVKLGQLLNETVYSCESSLDNIYSYKENDENTNFTTSSSPEVSSTTSEDKNSALLLKITDYKASRISQINDGNTENKNPCCKFTEDKDYIQSNSNFPTHRPLLTKAAQKYIPPLKESMRDLKVKLSLPPHSLLKLKQLKIAKDEPKVCKPTHSIPRISRKPKPKFEDVLKSLDDIQIKMHKEKTKKSKKSIPKVVIKKNENGSHYASTSNKNEFNPDLTGRKWQPWVFLEKNHFIDKMAIKKKTKAIYSHRKSAYVFAEKFQKYKSVNSTKFVISPPISDCPSTGLKYTIRLKHNY